jgi:hypothetical protein
VQLVARRLDEVTVLRAARRVEEALGFSGRPRTDRTGLTDRPVAEDRSIAISLWRGTARLKSKALPRDSEHIGWRSR